VEFDGTRAEVRKKIRKSEFDQYWAQGEAMTLEQALAYALN
jgi:hypothetical protein